MTTLSHAAVGLLVTKFFVDRGWLPDATITPYILGVAFANIPDIDGLVSLRKVYDHHSALKNLSHYPANWFIVFGFVAILALPFHIRYFYTYLCLATVNVFLHFILDTFSIYHGIAWFGPWNKKKYSFIRMLPIIPSDTHEWVHWYMKHWVLYLEIALWIVTLMVLLEHWI